MDNEYTFEIQKAVGGLTDLLSIKSGGEQFRDLSKVLVPSIDIRELIFPFDSQLAPSIQLTQAATSSTISKMFQQGRGLYRVRGIATLAGINGVNAGHFRVLISGVSWRMPIFDTYVAASVGFSQPTVVIDFLMDLRGSAETGFASASLTLPAAVTEVLAELNLVAIRIL